MFIFLILIFLFSFLWTVINLSLFNSKRRILIYTVIIGICIFIVYPLAVKINFQLFVNRINDFNVLSLFCVWQIIESIIFMFLSLTVIKNHYREASYSAAKYLILLPSLIFLTGLFGSQIYLFNSISGTKFYIISAVFSVAAVLIIFISAMLIKIIFRFWELRMELRILLSMMQIIISMFLPMLLMGIKIQDTQLQIEPLKTLITFISIFIVILAGYKLKPLKFRELFK